MILDDPLLVWTFRTFAAFVAIIFTYFMWSYQYWKRRNLHFIEPKFPHGSVGNMINRTEFVGLRFKKVYDEAKAKGWRHCGIYLFATPTYFLVDLDYVRNILAKDFEHFVDRGVYYNEKVDPIGAHLFAIGGTKWRNLRTKLTPTFTSGKMKMMFQTLVDCEVILQEVMGKLHKNGEAIDIKEVLSCFTTDIIGNCAFGLDCNSSREGSEGSESPFRFYGKKVLGASKLRSFLLAFTNNFPKTSLLLGLRQIPKDIADFYMKVVKDTVEYREKNNVTRKDFLQMLIELKNNNASGEYQHDGKNLTIEEVAAQSFVFFFAGFETSSTTMTFALYELARNQELQDKLRAEIKAILNRHGGQITYDSIADMKYLNQVIDETLRLYPPVPLISRECVKDYKVPDDDVVIEKGIRVFIPITAIHHDPEIYPDPEKFDPERFNEENRRSRHQYAHIPFGEGPRICIGMRFGLMQSKVGIISILRNYKLTVNPKTKEPLKMQVSTFIPNADGGIWLSAEKL